MVIGLVFTCGNIYYLLILYVIYYIFYFVTGVALTDSPVGLLTYILEKFSTWTRVEHKHLPDGGLTRDFTKEQLIDNLMVYWSSNCITTSMRLYAEILGNRNRELYLDGLVTKCF